MPKGAMVAVVVVAFAVAGIFAVANLMVGQI